MPIPHYELGYECVFYFHHSEKTVRGVIVKIMRRFGTVRIGSGVKRLNPLLGVRVIEGETRSDTDLLYVDASFMTKATPPKKNIYSGIGCIDQYPYQKIVMAKGNHIEAYCVEDIVYYASCEVIRRKTGLFIQKNDIGINYDKACDLFLKEFKSHIVPGEYHIKVSKKKLIRWMSQNFNRLSNTTKELDRIFNEQMEEDLRDYYRDLEEEWESDSVDSNHEFIRE